MQPAPNERLRISGRLKNALVADLVMNDLGEEADHWLVDPLRDEHGWTEHFSRQLGMDINCRSAGLHETLLLIILEVDELIRSWPPRHDIKVCRALAHEATKYLSPIELHATLLAGPPRWRRLKVEAGCTIEGLATHMQPLLEKELAAELNRVLSKWVEWELPKLHERRKGALKAAEAAQAGAEPHAARSRVKYQRPTGRERTDRLSPLYQPPGRT